jgi:hypothetical protein
MPDRMCGNHLIRRTVSMVCEETDRDADLLQLCVLLHGYSTTCEPEIHRGLTKVDLRDRLLFGLSHLYVIIRPYSCDGN